MVDMNMFVITAGISAVSGKLKDAMKKIDGLI